jgi:Electron transfer DM13
MHKWKIALAVLAIALFAAWSAFRPERLVVDHRINEGFPAIQGGSPPQAIDSGKFYGVVHPSTGTATIYRLADGGRILRLTKFKTSNGPNVHVYLVAADDAKDSETVKHSDFIDLGTIKGNIGDQNYTLGADLDISKYRTFFIWCKRFAVNCGAAPLRPITRCCKTSSLAYLVVDLRSLNSIGDSTCKQVNQLISRSTVA